MSTEPPPNRGLLVPHAVAKCRVCGSTLCDDPLPHYCVVVAMVSETDSRHDKTSASNS